LGRDAAIDFSLTSQQREMRALTERLCSRVDDAYWIEQDRRAAAKNAASTSTPPNISPPRRDGDLGDRRDFTRGRARGAHAPSPPRAAGQRQAIDLIR
jgi:hypothetical protein